MERCKVANFGKLNCCLFTGICYLNPQSVVTLGMTKATLFQGRSRHNQHQQTTPQDCQDSTKFSQLSIHPVIPGLDPLPKKRSKTWRSFPNVFWLHRNDLSTNKNQGLAKKCRVGPQILSKTHQKIINVSDHLEQLQPVILPLGSWGSGFFHLCVIHRCYIYEPTWGKVFHLSKLVKTHHLESTAPMPLSISSWWLSHPSEKYARQIGWFPHFFRMKSSKMFELPPPRFSTKTLCSLFRLTNLGLGSKIVLRLHQLTTSAPFGHHVRKVTPKISQRRLICINVHIQI